MSENTGYALLSLIPALLNAGIIFYIFFYLPKSRITDIFTCFVFALMLWQVEDTIVRLTNSPETARFWDQILCLGWLSMAPLAFHFACKLAGLKKFTSRLALFLIYGPFAIFYVIYVSTPEHAGFFQNGPWGWINKPVAGTLDEFQRYWISVVVLATVFILVRYAYATRKIQDKKSQAWIIAIGILFPALQGIVTQVIFPLVLNQPEIPVTSTFMTVFSIATIVAISRYKLFHVTESIQTDDLMENLNKIILILSPAKKIIYLNRHASLAFGIDRDNAESADIEKIFSTDENYFQKFSDEVFIKVLKGNPVTNYSSSLLNLENKKIDVLITANVVVNNNIVQGVMMVVNDITDMVTAINELEQERRFKEKTITNAVITAQEKERKTLGSELHDNVNQILASSLLYLNMIKKEDKTGSPHLEEMGGLIHHAIAEIRKLSHSLIAPSLNESELTEALDKIIDISGKTGTLTIKKQIENVDENCIPDELKLNLYRIVQEQFNNIIKYARAKTIHIKLIQTDKNLLLSIKDDGIGFDTSVKSKGVGLTNMKTRAALYNGELHIISSPGKGCELFVVFENFDLQAKIIAQKNGAGERKSDNNGSTYGFQLRTA